MNASKLARNKVFKVSDKWVKLSGLQAGDQGVVVGEDKFEGMPYWNVVLVDGRELMMIYDVEISQCRSLRDAINLAFTMEMLEDLCFDIGVDFDNLDGGPSKVAKTLSLIEFMECRGRIGELFVECCKRRMLLN